MLASPVAPGLYVAEPSLGDASAFSRIDARTLADVNGLAWQVRGYPVTSTDGSTVAAVSTTATALPPKPGGPPQVGFAVRIFEPRTGGERTAFYSPKRVFDSMLSHDGGQLVARAQPDTGDQAVTEWHSFDTHSGRVVSTMRAREACCQVYRTFLDAPGRLMYAVLVPNDTKNVGLDNPLLVRYDLASGKETGRLRLEGVLAHTGPSDRKINEEPVWQLYHPGVAVSPGGGTLALLHPDGEKLTLVDLERLVPISTRSLKRPSSFWRTLPFFPRAAYAKYAEGASWTLAYGPDGRVLYAAGEEMAIRKDGRPTSIRQGMRAIDPEQGAIVAEALKGQQIYQLAIGEDSAVYTLGPRRDASGPQDSAPYVLRRLDGRSLAVAAEREFPGFRRLLVVSASRP
jgi:hypothetical protein